MKMKLHRLVNAGGLAVCALVFTHNCVEPYLHPTLLKRLWLLEGTYLLIGSTSEFDCTVKPSQTNSKNTRVQRNEAGRNAVLLKNGHQKKPGPFKASQAKYKNMLDGVLELLEGCRVKEASILGRTNRSEKIHLRAFLALSLSIPLKNCYPVP